MEGETFTEWAERNGLSLAPWQVKVAEEAVRAAEQGDRITVITGKRGGWLTTGHALRDYWAEHPSPNATVEERSYDEADR